MLAGLTEPFDLMARVSYGSGLRLQECLELRVKDLRLEEGILLIRASKGDKDRTTVLSESLRGPLSRQLRRSRAFFDRDRADATPGVGSGRWRNLTSSDCHFVVPAASIPTMTHEHLGLSARYSRPRQLPAKVRHFGESAPEDVSKPKEDDYD